MELLNKYTDVIIGSILVSAFVFSVAAICVAACWRLVVLLHKSQSGSISEMVILVGSVAVVDTAILPGEIGSVRLFSDKSRKGHYQARSSTGKLIPEGEMVEILGNSGSVLIVKSLLPVDAETEGGLNANTFAKSKNSGD